MNDTMQTLVRSLFKIGAGYLLSKGLVDSSQAEELTAAGIGAAAVLWGIFHRSGAKPGAGAAAIAIAILLPIGFTAGCGSTPAKIAYGTAATTEVTVDQAMGAWGDYVKQFHPPAAQEAKVAAAYEKYQAAAATVADAGEVWATLASSGDTNAAGGAQTKVQMLEAQAAQDLADLVSLIRSFGIKL